MAGLALGLHGGCGTLDRSLMSEADWAESREHIAQALHAGWAVLKADGRAIDAVQATIMVLEDSPHFNAGYGAALTENFDHELDASIMDGATLDAGAVTSIKRVRNPIQAARAVLDGGKAVLLTGQAADQFAEQAGLTMVKPDYFTTQRRIDAVKSLKQRALSGTIAKASEAEKHGTVGAVARDSQGHLAAGTSTYARDGVCAVSCTGQGEVFIRRVAAYDVAARMIYGQQSLQQASDILVHKTLASHGIGAGMIVLGPEGDPLAPYNTLGMYRGWIGTDGRMTVATHHELHELGDV